MTFQHLFIVSIIIVATKAECVPKPHPEYYDFPQGFKWSTATAAFQIEGATREEGRGPSVWDEYTRKPGKIRDNTTADVTSDSYHKFREDIALMKSLSVTHYRFSISWSRIFPTGLGKPNPKGVQYYHDVIDALVESGIKPMASIAVVTSA
ncbi:glycosyl hydrolase, family 1 [Ancylostoma caninum]|uniref:Glycosyl hydrolase, family 1 n=1 Tax=Ancylostoma caninum TaxID=29170 RepID=A0A368FSE5_ANCCA|nr:glycosyl hydrolase, family 1 [Ancylostoma caninum]